MLLTPTPLADVVVVDLEPSEDERGFFARAFDADQFLAAGMDPVVAQCSISYNRAAGTVRGLHLQVAPSSETKLVRCTRGAVLDTVVDLREESPTYLRSFRVELTSENRRALYVPPYLGHGYQTLEDHTELHYQMNEPYRPGHERGVRHDDPALGLSWPLPVTGLSDKDRSWPLLRVS